MKLWWIVCTLALLFGPLRSSSVLVPNCSALHLFCENKGTFDNVYVAFDAFATTDLSRRPSQVCQCPLGCSGDECEIQTRAKCPGGAKDKLYFDSSYLNKQVNGKHAECEILKTPDIGYWGLHNNRVKMSINAKNLVARPPPRDSMCSPILNTQFSCKTKKCRTCSAEEGPGCFAIAAVFASIQLDSNPVILNFYNQHSNGTALGSFVAKGAVVVDFQLVNCITGMCVTNSSADDGGQGGGDRRLVTPFVITISIMACSTGIFLVVGAIAIVTQRKAAFRGARSTIVTNGVTSRYSVMDDDGVMPNADFAGDDVVGIDDKNDTLANGLVDVLMINGQVRTIQGSYAPLLERPSRVATQGTLLFMLLLFALVPLSINMYMQLDFSPVVSLDYCGITFENLSYKIQTADGERLVLDKVCGVVEPGEMVAVMGSSGSGKTSLLNILGARDKTGLVSGHVQVFFNNAQRLGEDRRHDNGHCTRIGYVQQDDALSPTQTVREALVFSARLRSNGVDEVERVLRVLRLTRIADSFIGCPDTGGISGGERRRVTIGIELVTKPSLLLLDEPVSGLDSTNASLVMDVLHDISRTGCACVLSIHQSSSSIFAKFDRLLLLAPTGHIAYFGSARRAFDFVTQVGFRMVAHNPPTVPEFLLDVAMGARQDVLCQRYKVSQVHEDIMNRIHEIGRLSSLKLASQAPLSLNNTKEDDAGAADHAVTVTVRLLSSSTRRQFSRPSRSCAFQLYCLVARSFRNVARDPGLLLTHIVVTTIIFWGCDSRLPGIQNRIGVLFMICVFFSLTSMSALPVFVAERAMFVREHQSGFYSRSSYFISQVLSDLVLLRFFPPMMFALVSYWMIGLQSDHAKFLNFVITTVLINFVAASLCMAMSSLAGSYGQASLFSVLIMIFSMMFGGLFLNNNTQTLSKILNRLSFIHYGYEALFVNEFDGLELDFNPDGFPVTHITGKVIIAQYSMEITATTSDIFTLVAWVVGYLLLAFVGLKLRTGSRLPVAKWFSILNFLSLAASTVLPLWARQRTGSQHLGLFQLCSTDDIFFHPGTCDGLSRDWMEHVGKWDLTMMWLWHVTQYLACSALATSLAGMIVLLIHARHVREDERDVHGEIEGSDNTVTSELSLVDSASLLQPVACVRGIVDADDHSHAPIARAHAHKSPRCLSHSRACKTKTNIVAVSILHLISAACAFGACTVFAQNKPFPLFDFSFWLQLLGFVCGMSCAVVNAYLL